MTNEGPPPEPVNPDPEVIEEADRQDREFEDFPNERALIEWIEGYKDAIVKCCAPWIDPQAILSTFRQMVMNTPDARFATRRSIILAVLEAASIGINPNGVRNASTWVVRNRNIGDKHNPNYIKELTIQWGYGDIVKLMMRSGEIIRIHPEVVFKGEEFEILGGTENKIVHKINMDIRNGPEEEREIVAAYCLIYKRDGTIAWTFIDQNDIKYAMKMSFGGGRTGPWATRKRQMAQKSSVIQVSKWELLDPYASAAIVSSMEHDGYEFENQGQAPQSRRLEKKAQSQQEMDELIARMNKPSTPEPQPVESKKKADDDFVNDITEHMDRQQQGDRQ